MLLIFSNKLDIATDFLISRLHKKNIKFHRINTEEYLDSWDFTITIKNNYQTATIQTNDGKVINIDDAKGAYIRQPRIPNICVDDEDKAFAKREISESLKSLWRYIPENVWLNAPHNILRASNKPEQLKNAAAYGLLIPNTCITAEIHTIKNFYHSSPLIIAKAVKHGFIFRESDAVIATTQNVSDDYIDNIEEYAKIPMIFQEKIAKEYDIRVTTVGESVFSVAIYSQEHPQTSTDWRIADHFGIKLRHEAIRLPQDIEDKCKSITRHYKLKYSAIDMIKSIEGKYYFLELNPNGQWAWLEQIANLKIRDAIISQLTQ